MVPLGRVSAQAVLAVSFEFSPTSLTAGQTHTSVVSAVTQYSYAGLGHVTQVHERVGVRGSGQADQWQVTDISYDTLGREIRREAPVFRPISNNALNIRPTTDTEYDGLGQVQRSIRRGLDNTTESDDRITRYTYAGNGRAVLVIDVEGNAVRHDYDANGDGVRQTYLALLHSDGSRRDQVKTFHYDAVGRLLETLDQDSGESRQMRYAAFGEVTAQGANGGYQEWFEYDVLGKVWKTNSGDGTVKVFLHDVNRNVTRELRAGLGSSTTRDLSNVTLAEVLADPTFVSSVRVYDARNLQVRTLQARMARLDNQVTLAEFTDTWVPQWGDLNNTTAGLGHTMATTVNGTRTHTGAAVSNKGLIHARLPLCNGS